MRNALLILGALFIVGGLLVAGGLVKYQDRDKVVDMGSVELHATHEKKMPLNWGYLLLGGGVVLLLGGAVARKR